MTSARLPLLALSLLASMASAQTTVNADGKVEYTGVLKYEPSKAGNVIVGGLYAVMACVFFFYIFRHRDKWALVLPIGALFSSIGFFTRLAMDPADLSIGLYATANLFVVISPAAFLAFNYMLYGRFIAAIDPEFGHELNQKGKPKQTEKSRFSLIPPRIVARIFVWSDVITFLIQSGAGGLQASGGSDNPDLTNIGDKTFLIGVTAQGVSYCLFTLLLTVAMFRLRSELGLDRQVKVLVSLLYFSSFWIIVRSVYRVIEFAQGYDGYLISKEIYLFILDAMPLCLAIGVWVFVWPPVVLYKLSSASQKVSQTYAMEGGDSASHPTYSREDKSYSPTKGTQYPLLK